MRNELKSPQSAPAPIGEQRPPTTMGAPPFSVYAKTWPASAATAPTERSIPPAIITSVNPAVMIPMYEIATPMLEKFVRVEEVRRLLRDEHAEDDDGHDQAEHGPKRGHVAGRGLARP